MKDYSINIWHTGQSPDEFGVINQKGLNRKVRRYRLPAWHGIMAHSILIAHLRLCEGELEAPAGRLHRCSAVYARPFVRRRREIDSIPGHRFDPTTPIEETMQALHDVVQAGYVRYIGMSSCHAYQCKTPLPFVCERELTADPQSTPCRVRPPARISRRA